MKEKERVLIAKSLLKVTFIMICISLILKLLGLNILEADDNSKILIYISNILTDNQYLNFAYSILFQIIQMFIFFRLSCKSKNKKVYYISAIIFAAVTHYVQWLIYYKSTLNESQLTTIYFIFTFLFSILFSIIIDLKVGYKNKIKKPFVLKIINNIFQRIKKPLVILFLLSIYQLVVMLLRNITYVEVYDRLYVFLLNFDYTILLLVTYYLFIKKETEINLKYAFEFSFPKLFNGIPSIDEINIMISNIKEKINDYKKMEKYERMVLIIYIFFFTLSELFNLALIVFIASLNHAIIECFFVVSSFLITRKVFGVFHFDAAWKCWIVSNLSFFILNKITLGVGITIVIPILCGISLAYITSKCIKKNITIPYRGMSKNELKRICKNKKLNELEMNILVDFYCNRESIIKLTYKYNYSEPMIYMFKSQALKKLV